MIGRIKTTKGSYQHLPDNAYDIFDTSDNAEIIAGNIVSNCLILGEYPCKNKHNMESCSGDKYLSGIRLSLLDMFESDIPNLHLNIDNRVMIMSLRNSEIHPIYTYKVLQ